MNFSSIGYKKPLYILAFDHRSAFAEKMFHVKSLSDLSPEQKHDIKEFKMLIYKGFKNAIEKQIPVDNAAILCDEEFGSELILDANQNGFITILTVEKSGEKEFKFQYGENFRKHIEDFNPTFVKVLIKYNPSDPNELKQRQKKNLKIVSDFCRDRKYKFLIEVLVLPTEIELRSVGGREKYDETLRPLLTVDVIREMHETGIEPDIWKLEGFSKKESYKKVISAARENGRENVSLVILGRGESEEKVDEWLRVGSKIDGVIGFAVGRTIFWEVIEKFHKGEIGKASVIDVISKKFQALYKVFTFSSSRS